jgi:hypothetical protein
MCGLAGFNAVKNGEADPLKLKLLLQNLSETRGTDSTGIFCEKTGIVKSVDKASKFLESLYGSKDIDFNTSSKESPVFIGHVRRKTTGDKKVEHAHPFNYDNIVGAHNGEISNYKFITPKGDVVADYPVDSMVIFARIGKEKNFKVLNEMIGPAAILFYNKTEPTTLYVYRNSERPLYSGKIEGQGVYFSSTMESLKIIDCTEIEDVTQNILYKYTNGVIEKQWKIARAIDFDSLQVNYSTDFKSMNELLGFNILIENRTHITDKLRGKYCFCNSLVKTNQWDHTQGKHVKKISENQVAVLPYNDKGEIEETEIETYLTYFVLDSYNAFFQQGSIVRSIRKFMYAKTKKNKNADKTVACVKHELFSITEPLKSRKSGDITIRSLLDPEKCLIMSVSNLEAVVTKDVFDASAKEIGLNAAPLSNLKIIDITPEEACTLSDDDLKSNILNNLSIKLGKKLNNKLTIRDISSLMPDIPSDNMHEANIKDGYEIVFEYLEEVLAYFQDISSERSLDADEKLKLEEMISKNKVIQGNFMNLYESYTTSETNEDGN